MKSQHVAVWGSVIFSLIVIILTFTLSFPRSVFSQSGGATLTGYAWSDTIGWIDLNCSNTSTCGTNSFGISVASDGTLSGYAWSDNVGWVSANATDLTACPAAPCTAVLSTSALTGWLRVISGGTAESGGWDGFISLGGAGYGITYASGNFSGYAWGDVNLGWIDFSLVHSTYQTCASTAGTVYTCTNGNQTVVRTDTDISCNVTVTNTACTPPQFCSPGVSVCLWPDPDPTPTGPYTGDLQVRPSLVPKGASTTVAWNIASVASCLVSSTNGDSWNATSSARAICAHTADGACISSIIQEQTVFTLTCDALDPAAPDFVQTATVNIIPGFEESCGPGQVHVDGKCVFDQ